MRDPGADACADPISGANVSPERNPAAQARPRHAFADTLADADRKSDPEPNADSDAAADLGTGRHQDRNSSRGMHPRSDTVSNAERIADTADDRLTKRAGDRIAKRSSVLIATRKSTTVGVGSARDTHAVTDEIGTTARMKN